MRYIAYIFILRGFSEYLLSATVPGLWIRLLYNLIDLIIGNSQFYTNTIFFLNKFNVL